MLSRMASPVDPKTVLRDVLSRLSGARSLAVSMAALSAFLVAAFLPIPAAYELWRVDQVAEWREVPVRLDAVEKRQPTFGKGPSTWRYTFTDPETGKLFETADIEPGDFPFTVMGWSTIDATGRSYKASVGQTIYVRRSDDGEQYFLRPGDHTTMTALLGFSGLYWLWLISGWRRRRRMG
jgi:hypothetical protein